MIVVMEKGASQEQVDHMVQRVEELDLKSHVIVGAERTVIAAIGDADSRPLQASQPRSQARTDFRQCRQFARGCWASGRDSRTLQCGE